MLVQPYRYVARPDMHQAQSTGPGFIPYQFNQFHKVNVATSHGDANSSTSYISPSMQQRARGAFSGGSSNYSNDVDPRKNRKAQPIQRRTVDYTASTLQWLRVRKWKKSPHSKQALQPDTLYYTDMVQTHGYKDNPVNAVTTRFIRAATNKIRSPIFAVKWMPDGRRLVSGASNGEFTLWNGLTFNFETIIQAHDTAVRAMTWSNDDNWLLSADQSGIVKYRQPSMNGVKSFVAHSEPVRGITKFATCSDDGSVKIWDFLRCTAEKSLRGHGADVKCVDWHPNKGLIVSGSKDSQQPVKLWDPRTGSSLATIHAHKSTVMAVKWNMNGHWLLTASRDRLVKVYDIRMMSELQTCRGHKREASAIDWHPVHENLFVSGGSDGSLFFWLVGKFWTRNRPGEKMRDKYNLNTLPLGGGEDESFEADFPSYESSLPDFGPVSSQFSLASIKLPSESRTEIIEFAGIPGLDSTSHHVSTESVVTSTAGISLVSVSNFKLPSLLRSEDEIADTVMAETQSGVAGGITANQDSVSTCGLVDDEDSVLYGSCSPRQQMKPPAAKRTSSDDDFDEIYSGDSPFTKRVSNEVRPAAAVPTLFSSRQAAQAGSSIEPLRSDSTIVAPTRALSKPAKEKDEKDDFLVFLDQEIEKETEQQSLQRVSASMSAGSDLATARAMDSGSRLVDPAVLPGLLDDDSQEVSMTSLQRNDVGIEDAVGVERVQPPWVNASLPPNHPMSLFSNHSPSIGPPSQLVGSVPPQLQTSLPPPPFLLPAPHLMQVMPQSFGHFPPSLSLSPGFNQMPPRSHHG